VTFNIFGMPEEPTFWWPDEPIKEFRKSDGHVIDHYGSSYPKTQPVHDRMKAEGVEIVKGIAWGQGLQMKSFFIRAPEGVLIESVESDPLPDASWLRHVHSGHQ
jgi:catechol 2,3-dioxygenase-like lactoylglutathione lyase family enzyme